MINILYKTKKKGVQTYIKLNTRSTHVKG